MLNGVLVISAIHTDTSNFEQSPQKYPFREHKEQTIHFSLFFGFRNIGFWLCDDQISF